MKDYEIKDYYQFLNESESEYVYDKPVTFFKLKPEKFEYVKGFDKSKPNSKIYKKERWISSDNKIFITRDPISFVRVYKASKEGKGSLISELYHKGLPSSYSIYSLEDAIKKIRELKIEFPYEFKVNLSHRMTKQSKIVI